MPSKDTGRDPPSSMLPTAVSAADLAEMAGNQAEDENMKTFMKVQS